MTENSGREAYQSLKIFDKCIVPELITGRLREKVEAQGFIKDLLNAILASIFKT